jgi:hypothetical protein
MFCSDSQVGRTRVSKVREGLKTKKTHVQHKKDNRTGLDKVFLLQNELFKEGLDLDEYVDYITDKIENKKYFYNGLNSDNIEALKKRYSKLIEKENTRYNQLGDEKRVNRKRRRQFREKKRALIREKKESLIDELYKNMKSSQSLGILRNTDVLSNDPDRFNNTKLNMFTGTKYIEIQDKKWVDIYAKLSSPHTYHLFDLHSTAALNQYVFEN